MPKNITFKENWTEEICTSVQARFKGRELWVLCLILTLHLMLLFQHLRAGFLLWWEKEKEWIVDGCLLCVFFLFFSPLSLSSVSVVFDFNASLNDVAPASPNQFAETIEWKGDLLMDVFCVFPFVFTTKVQFSECCVWFQSLTQWCDSCVSNSVVCWCDEKGMELIVDWCFLCVFLLFSLHRVSFASVVFDFSDSLNDVAPVSPISFTESIVKRKEWFIGGCLLCFSLVVFTHQSKLKESCVWFQCLTQWYSSSFSNVIVYRREEKGKWNEWIIDGRLLCVFSLLSLQLSSSAVSVLFDFNDSLNAVAPVSPITLSVDIMIKSYCWWVLFICLHNPDWVQ